MGFEFDSFLKVKEIGQKKMLSRSIRTSIEISAAPATIWKHLLDFSKYEEWNPFLIQVQGEAKSGEIIKVTFNNGFKISPKLLIVDENKELKWEGKLAWGGLFDGQHFFILTSLDNGKTTTLEQGEDFSGILVPLLPGLLKETKSNFIKMNEALKVRCESTS